MSSQPVSAAPVNGSGESWDEARIQQALQRLKLLHVKVRFGSCPPGGLRLGRRAAHSSQERMLRDTVPKMIEPLIKKHPSRRYTPPSPLRPDTHRVLLQPKACSRSI